VQKYAKHVGYDKDTKGTESGEEADDEDPPVLSYLPLPPPPPLLEPGVFADPVEVYLPPVEDDGWGDDWVSLPTNKKKSKKDAVEPKPLVVLLAKDVVAEPEPKPVTIVEEKKEKNKEKETSDWGLSSMWGSSKEKKSSSKTADFPQPTKALTKSDRRSASKRQAQKHAQHVSYNRDMRGTESGEEADDEDRPVLSHRNSMALPPPPPPLPAPSALYQIQAPPYPAQHLERHSVNNPAASSPSTRFDAHTPMDPWDHRSYQEQQRPIRSLSIPVPLISFNSNGIPLHSRSLTSMHMPTHHFPAQHETPHWPRPSGYIHQPRLLPTERLPRPKQSYQQIERQKTTDDGDYRLTEHASTRGRSPTHLTHHHTQTKLHETPPVSQKQGGRQVIRVKEQQHI
jgi:hypothetical protein